MIFYVKWLNYCLLFKSFEIELNKIVLFDKQKMNKNHFCEWDSSE